jgi:CRISPR/Cas system-associated endoribonuclease Cas2
MIFAMAGARPTRLAVLAYDIACPRRAYQVRKALNPLHHAKQYSVFEAMLGEGLLRGLLAELSACCDFSADRLAVWWPREGLRLEWQRGRLVVTARAGAPCREPVSLRPNLGNFVVCYDVSDPAALRAVAAEVAAEGAMIQRSVYWLRLPARELSAVLGRCAPHLAADDRLWAYPLGGSGDLWHLGAPETAILPISTYRWRSS